MSSQPKAKSPKKWSDTVSSDPDRYLTEHYGHGSWFTGEYRRWGDKDVARLVINHCHILEQADTCIETAPLQKGLTLLYSSILSCESLRGLVVGANSDLAFVPLTLPAPSGFYADVRELCKVNNDAAYTAARTLTYVNVVESEAAIVKDLALEKLEYYRFKQAGVRHYLAWKFFKGHTKAGLRALVHAAMGILNTDAEMLSAAFKYHRKSIPQLSIDLEALQQLINTDSEGKVKLRSGFIATLARCLHLPDFLVNAFASADQNVVILPSYKEDSDGQAELHALATGLMNFRKEVNMSQFDVEHVIDCMQSSMKDTFLSNTIGNVIPAEAEMKDVDYPGLKAMYRPLDCSRSLLSGIERGQRQPNAILLSALARVYRKSHADIERLNFHAALQRLRRHQSEGSKDLTKFLNLTCDALDENPECLDVLVAAMGVALATLDSKKA